MPVAPTNSTRRPKVWAEQVALEQRLALAILIWSESSQRDLDQMPRLKHQERFFLRLGKRVRELRRKCGYSQEDMISYGFSARHWQQIEAGRPITVSTLLRICATFATSIERLVKGLDKGIYED